MADALDNASAATNRFLMGHNDADIPRPHQIGNIYGGSGGYTEDAYQAALRTFERMSPSERAYYFGNQMPRAPELNPGIANVNLQRGFFNPYVQSLADAAAGNGPSQAQNLLREGTATAIGTQYGMAAAPAVGGAQRAALMSNAAFNAAGTQQGGARQAAQLRAQEMTDARSQLGTALQSQQGLNLQAIGLDTERQKANQSAQLGQNQISSQVGEQNRGGVLTAWGKFWSDIRAKEDIRPLSFDSTLQSDSAFRYVPPDSASPFDFKKYLSSEATPIREPVQEKKGIFGNLFGSDERSKEQIRSLEGALAKSEARNVSGITDTHVQYPQLGAAHLDLEARSSRAAPTARFADMATPEGSRQALGPVDPYEYRYKPEFAAATGEDTSPRAGIMAQDLELSPNPALRSAVVDTPMGKAIDGKRAVSANLALSAGLDKRLRNIEGALSQPTAYATPRQPSLMLSDKHSKETIKNLSEALVERQTPPPAAAPPVVTGPTPMQVGPPMAPLDLPEGRMITPLDETERKTARVLSRTIDPNASTRALIDSTLTTAPPGFDRWAGHFTDPDLWPEGSTQPPRYY